MWFCATTDTAHAQRSYLTVVRLLVFIYIFFYQIFRAFSLFLIVSRYNCIIFYSIIISANQVVYCIGKSICRQSRVFLDCTYFWFLHKYYVWYFVWCYHERTVENMKISSNLILTSWHL